MYISTSERILKYIAIGSTIVTVISVAWALYVFNNPAPVKEIGDTFKNILPLIFASGAFSVNAVSFKEYLKAVKKRDRYF